MKINMKKQIISAVLFAFISCNIFAQSHLEKDNVAKISVAFYNLENLFDTEDGPNNDAEFLPNGSRQWTEKRYKKKLHNLAYAISRIANDGPDILGVAEIENRKVLEDLIAQAELKEKGYDIVHFESPDYRGIDCALIYKPNVFKLTNAVPHAVNIPGEPDVKTRDVVEATGEIFGEPISFLVGHWPSRSGGEEISKARRMAAALVMRRVTDSLENSNPNMKVIMMGDFNDDPTSESLKKGLNSVGKVEDMKGNTLFNTMEALYKNGYGSYAYRDVWNLLDNIVVNKNLIDDSHNTLSVVKDPESGYYGHVFNAQFLTDKRGRFKGYPHRTFSYGQFINGYSDHYPTYIYIAKKIK